MADKATTYGVHSKSVSYARYCLCTRPCAYAPYPKQLRCAVVRRRDVGAERETRPPGFHNKDA